MPYIETYWDYELKKECFKVCGEKGYVHTTDTALSRLSEPIDTALMEYFIVGYDVNVLRDVGDGKVVFYDGDMPIDIYTKTTSGGVATYTAHDFIDWNDQMVNSETVYLQLSYEAEHNIQARYLGNKNCLSSKSVIDTIQVELPSLFTSTLEYTGKTSFTENWALTLPFEFTSGNTSYPSDTKTIKIYLDDSLIGTQTISLSNGTGTTTLSYNDELKVAGQHILSAVFEGDNHNERTSVTVPISIGYIIEIVEYDKYTLSNRGSLTATVTDYLGNGLDNKGVTWSGGQNIIKIENAHDGVFTVDYSNVTIPEHSYVHYGGSYSEALHITSVVVNDVSVSTDTPYVGYGQTIDVELNLDIEDTNGNTVHASGLDICFNDGVSEQILTVPSGEQGSPNIIRTTLTGAGVGNRVLSASIIGGVYILATIEDYYQIWHSGAYEYNQEYEIFSHTFQELVSSYKLKVASDGGTARIGLPTHSRDWEIRFLIESCSSSQMYFRFGNQIDGNFVGESYLGTFKRSQVIKIVQSYSEGTVKLYVNNTLKKTFTGAVNGKYAYFGIGSGTKGTYMAFDYLNYKLKNVVGGE